MRKEKPNFTLDKVPQVQDTSSETKKMTGFGDISDVAAAAPEKANSSDIATPARVSRSTTGTGTGKRLTAEQKKEEEKNKLVEEALGKVGTQMMSELARLPYEAWALFFADPGLKLTEDQAKTLAESYFLIAKAIKPEAITSWKILIAFAALQNTRIVLVKLREHNEREDRLKKMQNAQDEQLPQVSSQVSVI